MSIQHQITESKPLLSKEGYLTEPGYATSLLPVYSRKAIKASTMRIKEWDYYVITDGHVGLALTVSDNGYLGLMSASLLDFDNPKEKTSSLIIPFTLGKLHLPESTEEGITHFENSKCRFHFEVTLVTDSNSSYKTRRHLTCFFKNFTKGQNLSCDIVLEEKKQDTMVIATPFKEKKTAFYYNQKINCMKASGYFEYGNYRHEFNPEISMGLLDWGRGVWTYENMWYWSSGSGMVNGHTFGFNLGYGFGDTSAASENMLFYDGKAHKLDQISINIPSGTPEIAKINRTKSNSRMTDDFLSPWTISSNDGRFEMDFIPILDRAACTAVGPLVSDQHQVFGKFSGKAILDDGTEIILKDFLGFAEKVHNKW